MNTQIIIFDTNAVRELSSIIDKKHYDDSINSIVEKLSEKQLDVYISPIVLGELLCHVDKNGNQKEFNSCCNAIRNIMSIWEKFPNHSNMIAWPADMIIAELFYQHPLKDRALMYQDFVGVAVEAIAHKSNDEIETIKTTEGETLASFFKKMRKSFTDRLFAAIDKTKELTLDRSHLISVSKVTSICYTFISMVHELLHKDWQMPLPSERYMSEPDHCKRARLIDLFMLNEYQRFEETFPAAAKLSDCLSEKIYNSRKEISYERVGNYLQDIYMSFHIGQCLDFKKVLLVTSDKDILKSAEEVNKSDCVMDFKTFVDKCNLSNNIL